MDINTIDAAENKQRMLTGELYYAFTPDLIAERERCTRALERYNDARGITRRRRVELWRDLVQDARPMPSTLSDAQADEDQFNDSDPWTEAPIRADYGYNVRIAPGAYLNANATFLDTVPIYIGARTLIGSGCSFFSGGHPTDPAVRHGTRGPEFGKEINIGEDCWLGGNVTVLPGVNVGRGTTIGAGSVVSRDLPAFVVAVGVPARVVKSLKNTLDNEDPKGHIPDAQ